MEIKILGVCGSPIKRGNAETLLRQSLEAAEATGGVKTEMITMAGKNIKDCRHCDWCLTKQEEGKFCAQKDDMTEIYPKVLEADALLLASPVYIARLSGHMACFIDRLRVFAVGKLYHGSLRNRVGSALAVAWGRNLGLETTLLSIASGFMIMEMIVVGPPHGFGAPFGAAARHVSVAASQRLVPDSDDSGQAVCGDEKVSGRGCGAEGGREVSFFQSFDLDVLRCCRRGPEEKDTEK